MNKALEARGTVFEVSVSSTERISRINFSLQTLEDTAERGVVVVVRAWRADGASVSDTCGGLYFSKLMDEMFAYLPPTKSKSLSAPIDLKFAEAPTKVTFELLQWPERTPLAAEALGAGAFFVESWEHDGDDPRVRRRILRSGDSKT